MERDIRLNNGFESFGWLMASERFSMFAVKAAAVPGAKPVEHHAP